MNKFYITDNKTITMSNEKEVKARKSKEKSEDLESLGDIKNVSEGFAESFDTVQDVFEEEVSEFDIHVKGLPLKRSSIVKGYSKVVRSFRNKNK